MFVTSRSAFEKEAEEYCNSLEVPPLALGINDLSCVGGEWDTSFPVGFRYHVENPNKLRKGFFPGVHEGVATWNGGNLGDPRAVVLPVKNDLVIVEFHDVCQSIR